MTELQDVVDNIRRSQTGTERLYWFSPLLLALYRAIPVLRKAAFRKASEANTLNSENMAALNKAAVDAIIGDDRQTVRSGPFASMKLGSTTTGGLLGPMLFGTYEREIAGWFTSATLSKYTRAIDVGCAEGYYAVGMALNAAALHVHAFDLDERSRTLTSKSAEINGVVDRVDIGASCDEDRLNELLGQPGASLVLVDIEGFEYDWIDPRRVPGLKYADIVVELHEHARPGVSWRLLNRFVYTHSIELVSAMTDAERVRRAKSDGLVGQPLTAIVSEHRRLPQLWIRLTSLSQR